jgi:hypothetical protein
MADTPYLDKHGLETLWDDILEQMRVNPVVESASGAQVATLEGGEE